LFVVEVPFKLVGCVEELIVHLLVSCGVVDLARNYWLDLG
jgi:hypothetical protein